MSIDDLDTFDFIEVLDAHQRSFEYLLDLVRKQQEQIDWLMKSEAGLFDDIDFILERAVFHRDEDASNSEDYDPNEDAYHDPYDDFLPFSQSTLSRISEAQKAHILTDLAICLDQGRLADFVSGYRVEGVSAVSKDPDSDFPPHPPQWVSLARKY